MKAWKQDRNRPVYKRSEFEGACGDSGAEQSVIGLNQDEAYRRSKGRAYIDERTGFIFKFVDGQSPRIGMLKETIPFLHERFIEVTTHVVYVDVSMIIGIEVLQKHEMILDLCQNVIPH